MVASSDGGLAPGAVQCWCPFGTEIFGRIPFLSGPLWSPALWVSVCPLPPPSFHLPFWECPRGQYVLVKSAGLESDLHSNSSCLCDLRQGSYPFTFQWLHV